MTMRLNLAALIEDLGGASKVAQITGVPRTAPYGWIARDFISSRNLNALKTAYPDLDLDAYFDGDKDDNDNDA